MQPSLAVTRNGTWFAYLKSRNLWIRSEKGDARQVAETASDPVLSAAGDNVVCVWEQNGRTMFEKLN